MVQLKFAFCILSVVTGGLALVNGMISWIAVGKFATAGYIVGSVIMALGAAALIALGILLLVKVLPANNWVLLGLVAAALASSVMFANTVQSLVTVILVGLLILYTIVKNKDGVKAKAKAKEKVKPETKPSEAK